MKYIVLDFEWNSPGRRGRLTKEPIVLHGEIIQIGAVMLNEDLEEISSFEVKIVPTFYTRMNRKVEELTGITIKDLENGEPFKEAINKFKDWIGEDSVFLTWGQSDKKILEENLTAHEVDCSWIPETFDAQLMFDFQETMDGRNYSLDYAMYYFNLRGNKAHDALNDAKDTATVVRELDVEDFIKEEREWRIISECIKSQCQERSKIFFERTAKGVKSYIEFQNITGMDFSFIELELIVLQDNKEIDRIELATENWKNGELAKLYLDIEVKEDDELSFIPNNIEYHIN